MAGFNKNAGGMQNLMKQAQKMQEDMQKKNIIMKLASFCATAKALRNICKKSFVLIIFVGYSKRKYEKNT